MVGASRGAMGALAPTAECHRDRLGSHGLALQRVVVEGATNAIARQGHSWRQLQVEARKQPQSGAENHGAVITWQAFKMRRDYFRSAASVLLQL